MLLVSSTFLSSLYIALCVSFGRGGVNEIEACFKNNIFEKRGVIRHRGKPSMEEINVQTYLVILSYLPELMFPTKVVTLVNIKV